MSGEASEGGSGSGSRPLHGFPNLPGQDRYIQRIISHANDLLPDRDYDLYGFPQVANGEVSSSQDILNPAGNDHREDDQLDDFDRQLLGGASTPSFILDSAAATPRLSLPSTNISLNRQHRVLGDASHHFRPFAPRSDEYRPSQFISNPINLSQLSPSPATRPIFGRDGSRTASELHRGLQLATPPLHAAEPRQIPSQDVSLASSSSPIGMSSPSNRYGIRRPEPRISNKSRSSQIPTSSGKVVLSLDHAPDNLAPKIAGVHLVNPRTALSDKCRAVFPYEVFNVVQSKCFPHVYGSDDNVVISAPTGSGKTAILEMAICKLVATPGGENFKVVYQAPTKSLCSERAKDWEKKFSHLGLQCVELTGDTSPGQVKRVGGASIIVTTPEKWDSITRKWADHRKLLDMVRLVLIDEVHILKDLRGATLEAVVSRMKTSGANVRFVALSATVPNLDDLAAWLGRDHKNQQKPARQLSFGEEMRPVKLKKYVYGYPPSANDFIFDKTLDGKLNMLLGQHAEHKPIMVFCFTRKSCEQTAQKLAEWWTTISADDKPWPAPTERVPVINKELQEIIRYGVSFHHAGLDAQDRSSIERNYLNGQLHVICCTSTLAVGVNLPCHTIVLKGTSSYGDNGLQEYSDLEVTQMLGRAGRPQFDRSATAIIMTKQCHVDKYEKMISGQEVLESKLHLNLIEHLNSEIGLGTIHDLDSARKWISGTFLYVRMRQAPDHYRSEFTRAGANPKSSLDDWVRAWCERDIDLLQKNNLVTNDMPFRCTEYGVAMSKYMVQFETMRQLLDIPRAPSLEELLKSLSQTADFRDLRFKPQEKSIMRMMNSSVLYPITGPISDVWHKIFLLVQITLAGLELPTEKDAMILRRQIATEKNIIFDRMNRLVRCVIECKIFDGDGAGVRAGLELTRAIAANAWEGHPAQLQQIPGLGPVTRRKFESHNIRTIKELAGCSFVDIERIAGRNPPYGKNLLKPLAAFPQLEITAEIFSENGKSYKVSGDTVSVAVKVRLSYRNAKVVAWNGKIPAVTFLSDTTDGRLANFWRGNIKKLDEACGLELKFIVALSGPDDNITCYFSCEEIVGTQVTEILSPNIPASAFPGVPKRHIVTSTMTHYTEEYDSIDEGSLADEDLLGVLDVADVDASKSLSKKSRPVEYDDDSVTDFPDIENLLNVVPEDHEEENAPRIPTQMENGKWMCNHHCAGGALTKNGRPCTHKCCHEGLDKPRPAPQKKKASNLIPKDSSRMATETDAMSTHSSHRKGKVTGDQSLFSIPQDEYTTQLKRDRSSLKATKGTTSTGGSKRRLSESSDAANRRSNAKGRKKQRAKSPVDNAEVECIDLCALTDDDEEQPMAVVQNRKVPKKDQRLHDLHDRIQPRDSASSRLMKPCKSTSISGSTFNQSPQLQDAAESDSGNDLFDNEDGNFPKLEELMRTSGGTQEARTSRIGVKNNDTLCPSVFEIHQESKDFGWEPSLSFTTASELEKASRRSYIQCRDGDLIPSGEYNESPTALDPNQDVRTGTSASQDVGPPIYSALLNAEVPSSVLNETEQMMEHSFLNYHPLEPEPDAQKPATALPNSLATPLPGEPAWVGEYDEELINMLRGSVDFID